MFWMKTFKFHWRTSGQRMSCAPAETLRERETLHSLTLSPSQSPSRRSNRNDAALIAATRALEQPPLITSGTAPE